MTTSGGFNILVDTTPDFRGQALAAGLKSLAGVLFTHTHADHLHGFDDLRAVYFAQRRPIACFLVPHHLREVRSRFAYAFEDTGYLGTAPKVDLCPITIDQEFSIEDVAIEPVALPHGGPTTTGFRVGSFAYLTDFKGFPDELRRRWRGRLHTVVASAPHFGTHPTHNSVEETVQIIQDLGASQGIVSHLSHLIDHARDEVRLPPNVKFAYDGMVIDVP